MIFDETQCSLGEGPLWHPERQSLFWFDINNQLMFERGIGEEAATVYEFDEQVSAAGWVDENTLLIATETALIRFDLIEGESQYIVGLESDNPKTRSNDGRADLQGGFWIGTMGKNLELKAGAIYRYYDGELRKLISEITVPNSICFAPDGKTAFFCDTPMQKIMKLALDEQGWPVGKPEIFSEVAPYLPDGSVVDQNGNLWNAQWGAGRVACYAPNGEFLQSIEFPASQTTCPAFGSAEFQRLFVTSASENLKAPRAEDGKVFAVEMDIRGVRECPVKL